MLNALKLPGFRWIATLYALDYLVELAAAIALMVLVYDATDSPVAASMMLLCKQVVPGTAVAVVARVLERVSVRGGLASAYFSAGVAMCVLALIGYGPALYVAAFVAGITGSMVRALLRVAVARSNEGLARRAANAFLNVLMGVVALLGPVLGGALVALSTPRVALAAMAAGSCLLALISLAMPRELSSACASPAAADVPAAPDGSDDATSQGGTTPVALLLVIGGVVLGLFAMDEPALLAYTRDALGSDVDGYALLLTAWGVGMLVGGVLYGRLLGYRMAGVFGWGAAVGAVGYLGLGAASTLEFAIGAALFGGVGNGMFWVALVTAIQEAARDDEQGKWSGRLEGAGTAAPALGVLVGGLTAQFLSPRASFLIPGVLVLAILAAWGVGVRIVARRARAAERPAAVSVPLAPIAETQSTAPQVIA